MHSAGTGTQRLGQGIEGPEHGGAGYQPDPVKKFAKFVERDELNFQLLSDEDHATADKYGAWGPKKFMGREFDGILRTTFIVGKDGKLKAIMDKFKTKDHHTELLALLKTLDLG